MGAPVGNQNAAKAKRWSAAIERALERKATGDPIPTDTSALIQGLDMAADLFVEKMFDGGDLPYFKELGDRQDGKSVQQTEISGPDGGPVELKAVEWSVVHPKP